MNTHSRQTMAPAAHVTHDASHAVHANHYPRFLAMVVASFVAMFALMYVMVDRWAHVLSNLNQVYMAAVMAGAMVILELAFMWRMYPRRGLNAGLLAAAVAVVAISGWGVRYQWAVGDEQFLRSMIPHHAGAILMCEQADLRAPQIRALCSEILRSQRAEIQFMQQQLDAPAP